MERWMMLAAMAGVMAGCAGSSDDDSGGGEPLVVENTQDSPTSVCGAWDRPTSDGYPLTVGCTPQAAPFEVIAHGTGLAYCRAKPWGTFVTINTPINGGQMRDELFFCTGQSSNVEDGADFPLAADNADWAIVLSIGGGQHEFALLGDGYKCIFDSGADAALDTPLCDGFTLRQRTPTPVVEYDGHLIALVKMR